MRYFYDTEFIEDGKTIDLISIGLVCEDGRELYLQSCEFSTRNASDWVKENVFPWLKLCSCMPGGHDLAWQLQQHRFANKGQCTFKDPGKGIIGAHADCHWRTREQIKSELLAFMDPAKYGTPELWAYYADYDHVALCQLFGTMMDLPKGFPMYTLDLKQFCFHVGSPKLPEQTSTEHNALEDARHNKVMYEFLAKYAQELNDEVSRILGRKQE